MLLSVYESGIGAWKTHRRAVDACSLEPVRNAQVKGILACGTTGQSATLSHKEHVELVERIFLAIGNRCQFIASAGSNCTGEAIDLSKEIERRIGPTTFLHVTGYYNNPPQEGLLEHFTTIAENIGDESNLIMYNVPGRTKSYIEPATVIELAKHPRIIGLKQAVGETFHITSDESLTWNQIHEIIADTLNVKPNIVHIASDFIGRYDEHLKDGLLGDKSHSVIFDNSKIKKYVPDFTATIPFSIGIRDTISWFEEDQSRQIIREETNDLIDKIISNYE